MDPLDHSRVRYLGSARNRIHVQDSSIDGNRMHEDHKHCCKRSVQGYAQVLHEQSIHQRQDSV